MFQFAFIYANFRVGNIPDVYVQRFDWPKEIKEEIRKMYQQGIGERKDRVALHIRRGDYVDNPFYVDLTKTDYYDKAVKEFPGEKFLVFYQDRQGTNDYQDRKWVSDWLVSKGIPFEFWQGRDEIEDMNAMASCKGIIMANSSFSAWAAFLNPNDDKRIIAPKEYYTDGVERTVFPKDEGWKFI